MTITTAYGNYVKFLRGTPTAFENLASKDSDTLYFISEQNADRGVLYLGEKLISGGISSTTSLEDLADVLIGAGISAGSLLYYDGTQWVDKTLSEVLDIIVGAMVGATETTDGASGLVPAPEAGEQNLYLRGDATWADPTAALTPTVQTLVTQVGTLIGNDLNLSAREIAQQEVGRLVDGAPEAFDTLKEIADYLADNPSTGDIASRLTAVEGAIFTSNTGLQDRVTVLETSVGDLNTLVSQHTTQIANIQNDLDNLKWQDMIINND